MRFIVALLLAVLPSLSWSATSIDCGTLNKVTATMAITSSEDTLTLTVPSSINPLRVVQIVSDQAWGIANATGAFATKFPVGSGQTLTIKLQGLTQTFYVQASSTSGTLHLIILDNQ